MQITRTKQKDLCYTTTQQTLECPKVSIRPTWKEGLYKRQVYYFGKVRLINKTRRKPTLTSFWKHTKINNRGKPETWDKNYTKQRRWRESKEQLKKAYHIDRKQPKGMTLTPWSRAPAEDPKKPTKQPSNNRKNHKNEENHRGISKLYYWKVTCHTQVDSIAGHMYISYMRLWSL